MTVQQVIETEIPNLINKSYLVYQFPSKALLNPEKEASVLQGQEIWIELARMHSPGMQFAKTVFVMLTYLCFHGLSVCLFVYLSVCVYVYLSILQVYLPMVKTGFKQITQALLLETFVDL